MRLADFPNVDFGRFDKLQVEDVGFFQTMVARIIEDVEVALYVVARFQGDYRITTDIVRTALALIAPDSTDYQDAPETAIVNVGLVHDFTRAPIDHDTEALALLSRFVNFHVIAILRSAAEEADKEDARQIKLRHLLPWCEKWPYPLNRYC
jgi:hypothetical protein